MIRKVALLALAAAPLLTASWAAAEDHVVSRDALLSRLEAAESVRQRNLGTVDRFLSGPEAASAAASVRADLSRLRSGLAALDDTELAELAARVDALQDPVAGLDDDIRTLLIIFLIVAIVILVLQAVD